MSRISITEQQFNNLLLNAYRIGWANCIAGEDIRALDYLSDAEILKSIKEQLQEYIEKRKS